MPRFFRKTDTIGRPAHSVFRRDAGNLIRDGCAPLIKRFVITRFYAPPLCFTINLLDVPP